MGRMDQLVTFLCIRKAATATDTDSATAASLSPLLSLRDLRDI